MATGDVDSRDEVGADDVVRARMVEARRVRVSFDESLMDPDALRVVRRLVRHGFETYFVGGGVRDLLLGVRPKDFDVATSARPEQVRRLFRNSRIIGRRFRLVHVLFGPSKVIEVATFRRGEDVVKAEVGDRVALIRSDNVYGEAHEDALRRDLTINALLYDVQSREVLDFVGGMLDIRHRLIRTIGDASTRFFEDPVRMLRVIKFCARLDLGMLPEVYDGIVLARDALAAVSKPRLFDELLKVLRCGASHRAFWLMWETGLLQVVLPEVAALLDDGSDGSYGGSIDGSDGSSDEFDSVSDAVSGEHADDYLDDPAGETGDDRGDDHGHAHENACVDRRGGADRFWRVLSELDERVKRGGEPLCDVVLLTILLLEPLLEALDGSVDRMSVAFAYADPVFHRIAVPRRVADGVCRIAAILPKLGTRRQGRFSKTDTYFAALEVQSIVRSAQGLAI
ncbi:MAG: polynucleotide adenylyltransferase PcnB [Polyangiaceae bacterium]|nr:polynucleotide adenylyltransferase PcnB [Polyangiaceae bacterium]